MPYALIATTASKANLAGGTFADTLTANTGDSLAVSAYQSGGARVVEMWGGDSDSVAEMEIFYTRPESTHDQLHGLRLMIPAITPGGAGLVAGLNLLRGDQSIDVFASDTATIKVSGTAADDVAITYMIEYDDLPGISAQFGSWEQVKSLKRATLGIRVDAVANGTPGLYGATRAFNADDNRLSANTFYAILGFTVQTPVTTVCLTGKAWGNVRYAAPAGALDIGSDTYYVDQSIKRNRPLIPIINSNDAGNVLVEVADLEASTSPKIDFLLYELNSMPGA